MSDRKPKDRYVVAATYPDRFESWAYVTEAEADAKDAELRGDHAVQDVVYEYVRGYRGERHRLLWR